MNRSTRLRGRAPRSLAFKLAMSIGLVGAAAAIVGLGAFATFTGTATTSQALSSGTVSLAPVGTNATNNRLSVGASGLAAGDTIQRTVDLKNTGTIALATAT